MLLDHLTTHTQTLYLHTRFHCLLLILFPLREEFNVLIKVFYFVQRKLCFVLFCLVFVFISVVCRSNVSTVFVLAHTRWHNEQTQHPSASFSLFFFTAQIFFPPPNVSRRTGQPIWPLALAALSEILSDIERRWGEGPQEELCSGALVLVCAQVCRQVSEIGCKKVLMWIHKHLSQGCYMQKHETMSQGSCQALLEPVWSKISPWRHLCHTEQREWFSQLANASS